MAVNQHRQLTSAWFNIMGAGLVSGGIVSQLVAIVSGAPFDRSLAVIALCILTGLGLHLLAHRVSGDQPDR